MLFVSMSTLFLLCVTAGICEFAPSPLSYVCKPQCNSTCAGPSAACLGHALEQPNIYLGGSEPVGLFSLILAINLGVGRDAMVQLTPTLVGAGGKRYMTAERFSQRPWKLSFPYFVPSEQGDVL